jgi:hypothetical protein
MSIKDEIVAQDYLTLLDQGYVSRALPEIEHDAWRKAIRLRCRHDKLEVQTGPVYNGDAPPVEVEADLPARWEGHTVLALDADGNVVGRKIDDDADHLEEALRLAEDLDEQRET